MRIDIIIPTFNRATLLRECLESICLSKSAVDWRVTVVDNNSSDDTRQVVEEFSTRTARIRYLYEKRQGVSFALNCGIEASDRDVIGMINDDEQIHVDWIDIAAQWMQRPDVDFVGGPYLGLWRAEKPPWVPAGYESVISADDPGRIPIAPVQFAHHPEIMLLGGNAVVRRSAYLKVGLYRTDLGRSGNDLTAGEDLDMQARLTAAGFVGYYVPDLIIYHVIPPERLTRSYYRRWVLGQARSQAIRERENPEPVVYFAGVPRYRIRLALKSLPALMSSNPARRFDAELQWWHLVGLARGARSRS